MLNLPNRNPESNHDILAQLKNPPAIPKGRLHDVRLLESISPKSTTIFKQDQIRSNSDVILPKQ